MESAILNLTTKDAVAGPQGVFMQVSVGKLVFEMEFGAQINNQISVYRFKFTLDGGTPFEFWLAGNDCTNFFGLLDTILTPNQPNPHVATLNTSDPSGAVNGKIDIGVARDLQFVDGISLFSYSFAPNGVAALSFKLTSTDAGGMFYVFDDILWSNPPSPPH
jgi:hypothetical protein